jgi:hypothetical protein
METTKEGIAADYLDVQIEKDEIINYKAANDAFINAMHTGQSMDHIFGKDNSVLDVIKSSIKPYTGRQNTTTINISGMPPEALGGTPKVQEPSKIASMAKSAILGAAIAGGPMLGAVGVKAWDYLTTPTPVEQKAEPQAQPDADGIEVF